MRRIPLPLLLLLLPLLALGAPAAAGAAGTIVVDDFGPGCRLGGVWADNKGNNGEGKQFSGGSCVGGNYHYTSNYAPRKKTGRETATWTPNLPRAGNYKVEVSFRETENRSAKVTYEVKHAKGVDRKVVNQRSGGKVALGVFSFAAGAAGHVALVSDGGGSASADAAFFTPTDAPAGGSAGGQSTLDTLVGGGSSSGGAGDLALTGPGERTFTAPADGRIRVTAKLATYGEAALAVTVTSGGREETWMTWRRADDVDGSPLAVGGKPDPESVFEQKPGDMTARARTHERPVKKGDRVTLSLAGDFGAGDPELSLSFSK